MPEPRFRRRSLLSISAALAVVATIAAQSPGPGVIAIMAVTREIGPIESRIESPRIEQVQGTTFTSGMIHGVPVVAVRSGVGKVNAAIAGTLLIERFSPAAVIFSGTAGAIHPDLRPGDVVIGTAAGHHDFGRFTEAGFVRGQIRAPSGELDPVFYPADAGLLDAARRAAKKLVATLTIHEGVIVTGDAFVAATAVRADLRKALTASAVEMEGAAVAQVCARTGTAFLVIRSITDLADGSANDNYLKHVASSSQNAADLAVATVDEYTGMWKAR